MNYETERVTYDFFFIWRHLAKPRPIEEYNFQMIRSCPFPFNILVVSKEIWVRYAHARTVSVDESRACLGI